jgi:hypothetical protein
MAAVAASSRAISISSESMQVDGGGERKERRWQVQSLYAQRSPLKRCATDYAKKGRSAPALERHPLRVRFSDANGDFLEQTSREVTLRGILRHNANP